MYQEKNDRQLLDLLSVHQKLTFESQLHLMAEFKKRHLDANLTELDHSIKDKKIKINHLDYLENMGFAAQDGPESIKIERTNKAVLMDIVAVIVGLILVFIGIYAVVAIYDSFYGDGAFNVFGLLVNVGLAYLGILGFQFLSGMNRLIDHSGFELFGIDQMITLRKRFDMKKVEIQKEPSNVHLSKDEGNTTLQLEEVDIMTTYSNNRVHKTTLIKLKEKLNNVS